MYQLLVHDFGLDSPCHGRGGSGWKGSGIGMARMDDAELVDWACFDQARASLGVRLFRHLGYLREDGAKAVTQIEAAMRAGDAVSLVNPADLLKAEAFQIGALGVASLAEEIEVQARDCIEWRQAPDNILEIVVQLRDVFDRTVTLIDKETNPLMVRHPVLRAKSEAFAAN